jgi:hypothetical protein
VDPQAGLGYAWGTLGTLGKQLASSRALCPRCLLSLLCLLCLLCALPMRCACCAATHLQHSVQALEAPLALLPAHLDGVPKHGLERVLLVVRVVLLRYKENTVQSDRYNRQWHEVMRLTSTRKQQLQQVQGQEASPPKAYASQPCKLQPQPHEAMQPGAPAISSTHSPAQPRPPGHPPGI